MNLEKTLIDYLQNAVGNKKPQRVLGDEDKRDDSSQDIPIP